MKRLLALFTDGACSGNPGPGGWAFVAALPDGRVKEGAGRVEATTNNRMEMTAVIQALAVVQGISAVAVVHTDSTYVLGGVTGWLSNWKRRGWRTAEGNPVKNEDLWRSLDAAVAARGPGGVEWRWVRGHDGHDANERCDALAVAMSRRRRVELYDGPFNAYPYGSLAPSPQAPAAPRPHLRCAPAVGGPVVYLSLLDGRLERHASWKECEARVKGRPARFKKVRTPGEEAAVRRAWGLD